jgi:hypothetical protein
LNPAIFNAIHTANATTSMLTRRPYAGGSWTGYKPPPPFYRDGDFWVLVGPLLGVLMMFVGVGLYLEWTTPPRVKVESVACVSTVQIERSSGSGNGKSKDHISVVFDNGLTYRASFNRRDGDPTGWVIGHKYKLVSHEGYGSVLAYERLHD